MNFFRRKKGQAAVEAVFCMPIMLLMFIIGGKLWAMTWNAQWAHVKARYELMETIDHKPCKSNNDGTQAISTKEKHESATVPGGVYRGPGMYNAAGDTKTMRAKAVVVCQ